MRTDIKEKIMTINEKGIIVLDNMYINDEDIQEIMELIKQVQPHLSVLSLDRNQLQDEGAVMLAEYLSNFSQLKELSIQFNRIARTGALSIYSLKNERPELKVLFHGNKIRTVTELLEIENLATQPSSSTLTP